MSKEIGRKSGEKEHDLFGYSGGSGGFIFRNDPWVATYMPVIEEALSRLTESPIGQVSEVARHIVFGSAKRLRPAFNLAGYLLTAEGLSPQAVELAACSEILHCATLFHDDVVDSSLTRKGRSSANALWGNQNAVILGDYLFGVSFGGIAKLKRQDIFDEYIQVAKTLAEGVLLELGNKNHPQIEEATYLDIISRKTASFFRAVTRAGAMLAGASRDLVDNAGSFAYNFGMAFQITDDILDLFSEETRTGKPRGQDIREGVFTLPLIYALRSDNGSLLERLEDGLVDDSDIDFIADRIESSGGLEYTVERASDYHRRSMETLDELPANDSSAFLRRTAGNLISRQF